MRDTHCGRWLVVGGDHSDLSAPHSGHACRQVLSAVVVRLGRLLPLISPACFGQPPAGLGFLPLDFALRRYSFLASASTSALSVPVTPFTFRALSNSESGRGKGSPSAEALCLGLDMLGSIFARLATLPPLSIISMLTYAVVS